MPLSYIFDLDSIIILFLIIAGGVFLKTLLKLKKRNRLDKKHLLLLTMKVIFWGYIALLIGVTLLPIFIPPFEESFCSPSINVIPFYGWRNFTKEIAIVTFLIIFAIESLQYIGVKFGFSMELRVFDVTDIILNYIGFVIGLALYKIYEVRLKEIKLR